MKRSTIFVLSVVSVLTAGTVALFADSAEAQKHWTTKGADARAGTGSTIDVAGLNRVFVDLAKNLSPAVVNIYTKTRVAAPQGRGMMPGQPSSDDLFRFFFGNPFGGGDMFRQPREANSLGSGFVINTDGTIITNSHVVRMEGRNADSIMVKFLDDPRSSQGHEATVVGVDEGTDVAVLRLKKKKDGLRVAPLGDSDKISVGEWTMAIGNPYGHSHSVTKGIVSALGRDLEASRAEFIQTDASINPGNSGGPLFNLYGEVIGINTAIDARAQGIGFAIPINMAKSSIEQIIEKGEVTLGWIGVGIAPLSPALASELGLKDGAGVLIQEVFPGEPADRAGLKSYDVVVDVNGRKIETPREFMVTVGGIRVGSKARLKVIRDGKEIAPIEITVAKRKSDTELAKQLKDTPGDQSGSGRNVIEKLGIEIADLSEEIRRSLGLDAALRGVVVLRVAPQGPAAAAGLSPGDVITEVNRKPARSLREAQGLFGAKSKNFLIKARRRNASVIVLIEPGTN